MRKGILIAVLAVAAMGLGIFSSAQPGDAAYHIMRVYGVMGGANGDTNIQYVELRMATGGQSLVSGHHICFFDASGAPYARFNFTANMANSASGASILIGSSEFDAAWAAGSPDTMATFNGSNTIAIAPLADVLHPIRSPGGKVSFGTDFTSTPSAMCQASFTDLVDSVAYGTGYTGTVNFGTKLNADLSTSGTNAVRLAGPVCFPGLGPPCARDNSVDYGITDVNTSGNNPRNNINQSGPITSSDLDGDGVPDASDLCPSTAPAAPVDANGCSQAQVDKDLDSFCDPGAVSAGPAPGCTGTDDCPSWANPAQALPVWPVPAGDSDCDGYPDSVQVGAKAGETILGTAPSMHCAATAAVNDEPSPDAWPVDFNDDQKATITDVTKFGPVWNAVFPAANYDQRFDYNDNNSIGLTDVTQFGAFFNKNCS